MLVVVEEGWGDLNGVQLLYSESNKVPFLNLDVLGGLIFWGDGVYVWIRYGEDYALHCIGVWRAVEDLFDRWVSFGVRV